MNAKNAETFFKISLHRRKSHIKNDINNDRFFLEGANWAFKCACMRVHVVLFLPAESSRTVLDKFTLKK